MIMKYNRVISYICPYCAEISTREINIFSFSGNSHVSLACNHKECGEECVSIKHIKDKYKIEMDCPVCGELHTYTLSEGAFWNRDIIILQCEEAPETDVLFIGKKKNVLERIKDLDVEDISEELNNFDEYTTLIYRIISRLDMLLRTDDIHCMCGSTDIIPNMIDTGIILECGKCHSKMLIEPTPESLDKLMQAKSICIGKSKKPCQ